MGDYGPVRLTLTDGSVVTWEESIILHERGDGFYTRGSDEASRVIVHSGNHVRASYRSDQVLSAVRVDMLPEPRS